MQPADLAGYCNDQVYIRRPMHTPPGRVAVRDLMPVKQIKGPAPVMVDRHVFYYTPCSAPLLELSTEVGVMAGISIIFS